MSLQRLNAEKNTGYLFFRNPPLSQISTFLLGEKGRAYYGKSAYYEWAQLLIVIHKSARTLAKFLKVKFSLRHPLNVLILTRLFARSPDWTSHRQTR